MKKHIINAILLLSAFLLGGLVSYFLYTKPASHHKINIEKSEKKPLYWVAPMDPNYRRDKPGKSPMGMDLVPVYEEKSNNSKIKIANSVEHNLAVKTARVIKKYISRQINTIGYVAVDESQIQHVHTYTDGWIKNLLVKNTGDYVKKGQLLFEIYSPTLINAQEEYLIALNRKNNTLIQASKRKLLTLGVSTSQINELRETKKAMELVKFFSPQSGIISELHIREGMHVKPDINVLTIEGLNPIWILGEVFESQSHELKVGQTAIIHMPSMPGQSWHGKVDYVYPKLDPISHTLKVRVLLPNENRILKPNMYTDITILLTPKKNSLMIPNSAIIYVEKGPRVILSLGNGQYKIQPIKVGVESGNESVVLAGLKEGAEVVTSAQFLLDSEANLKAELERIDTKNKQNVH